MKIIAPAVINALKEALTDIYWYKRDLRSFIRNTISDPKIVSELDWDGYKRDAVVALIDFLVRNQQSYKDDLLKLIEEVIRIRDFSYLKKLEDGKEKAKRAEESVKALRELVEGHFDVFRKREEADEKRKVAHEEMTKCLGVKEKLEEMREEYVSLIKSNDFNARGYKLEKIVRELFELFDLDPKASFKIEGEQIDGAFTFDNIDYLFEGKWQKELAGTSDLDAFKGKLERKLDNTLGLFLSINGFSEGAVKAQSRGRGLMILMDGADLMAVLDGRIDLKRMLLRKRRHASQTGNIYLRVMEII